MQHLPSELLNDTELLQDLSGWACHGQDIISDPTVGGGTDEMHRTEKARFQALTFSMISIIL